VFGGTYVGVKLPAERPALHAWLYDTRSKQAAHLGRMPYRTSTVGKTKAEFEVAAPAAVQGGKFGAYEVMPLSGVRRGGQGATRREAAPVGPDHQVVVWHCRQWRVTRGFGIAFAHPTGRPTNCRRGTRCASGFVKCRRRGKCWWSA
jgi:hypothetical protein